jgi:hypothetical protein
MSLIAIESPLFRCYYVADLDEPSPDPREFVPWGVIHRNDAMGIPRGRWDAPNDDYRVLHCANDEKTALVETLAEIRTSKTALSAIAAVEDEDGEEPVRETFGVIDPSRARAIEDRLRHRYVAELQTVVGELVYDAMKGRTEIESAFGIAEPLKLGSFIGVDREFSRRVSHFVYHRTGAVGVYCHSAEGEGYVTALFEDPASNSDPAYRRPRATLHVAWTSHALLRKEAIAAAVEVLGLDNISAVPPGAPITPDPAP